MKLVINGSYNRPIACLGWQAFAKEIFHVQPKQPLPSNDLHDLHQQILDTRLAMIVTHGEQGLQASHLPLLFEPGSRPERHVVRPLRQGQSAVERTAATAPKPW